jgi:hypothetical protein
MLTSVFPTVPPLPSTPLPPRAGELARIAEFDPDLTRE